MCEARSRYRHAVALEGMGWAGYGKAAHIPWHPLELILYRIQVDQTHSSVREEEEGQAITPDDTAILSGRSLSRA